MKPPTILFLSLYSNDINYSEHQIAQYETWLGDLSEIYWLRGNGSNTSVSIEGNFINCPVDESFENILTKRILGLRYAVASWECDFYVLMNTSTFVHVARLKKILLNAGGAFFAAAAHGKYISNVTQKTESFLAGNLIVLSKKAALSLSRMNADEWAGVADDIAISEYLKLEKCQFQYIERNDLTDFSPFKIGYQHRIKSWENSDITTARFRELNQIYNGTGMKRILNYSRHYANELRRYSRYHPPTRGLNMFRILKFLGKQAIATVMNIFKLTLEKYSDLENQNKSEIPKNR